MISSSLPILGLHPIRFPLLHVNMMIDSHAHLSFSSYSPEEIDEIINRAHENGVDTIINIGGGEGYEGNLKALELAEHYPQIHATVGIHPHDAHLVTPQMIEDLKSLLADKKVIAIGEVGLDFHYNHSDPKVQEEVFRQMIRLAKEVRLPMVLHVRDAYDRLYTILEEEEGFECGGVVHCFTGDWSFAEKMIEKGFYISFSGVITFKKSEALREVVRKIPTEKILIETDCPYLSPEPHRGKRNEPAYVKFTALKIAEIKKLTLDDVQRITSLNRSKSVV